MTIIEQNCNGKISIKNNVIYTSNFDVIPTRNVDVSYMSNVDITCI